MKWRPLPVATMVRSFSLAIVVKALGRHGFNDHVGPAGRELSHAGRGHQPDIDRISLALAEDLET